MLQFPCESCGMILKIAESQRHHPILCPNCNTQQPVPENAVAAFESAIAGDPLIVTTGNDIAGHTITGYLGIVRGIVVRPGYGQGLLSGLRSAGGGNIPEYAEVCEHAREDAYQLMLQQARRKNADALIAVRYDATAFSHTTTEIFAYGTAVKIEKERRILLASRIRPYPKIYPK